MKWCRSALRRCKLLAASGLSTADADAAYADGQHEQEHGDAHLWQLPQTEDDEHRQRNGVNTIYVSEEQSFATEQPQVVHPTTSGVGGCGGAAALCRKVFKG